MELLQNKNNNIIQFNKGMPARASEVNYNFNILHKFSLRLKRQGNTSRLLIIALIIWNIILTCQFIPERANIPQFTDKENQQIMIEEGIPPFDLIPIEDIEGSK